MHNIYPNTKNKIIKPSTEMAQISHKPTTYKSNNNIFSLRNKGVQIISEQASTSPQTELVDQSTASLLEGNIY